MHVVAVQLDIQWEDKQHNHARVRELLDSSEIPPGSLIVLPEMFDTGFSMDLGRTLQSPHRESEQFLMDLACRLESAVLGGVVSPTVNGKAANQAVAFDPSGNELARYCKQRPFSLVREEESYLPGNQEVIFEWQGVKISPFVCYDLRFPELYRPAALAGAELLVTIACWPSTRSEHWVRLLQARAIENLAISLGVNRCGEEPNLSFDGRSSAFDHSGVELFQADHCPQVQIAKLDLDALRRWREKFPALRDAQSTKPSPLEG